MKARLIVHQQFHMRKSFRKSRWNKARKRFLKRIGVNSPEKIGPFPRSNQEDKQCGGGMGRRNME